MRIQTIHTIASQVRGIHAKVEIFGILEPTESLTACVPIQSHGNFG